MKKSAILSVVVILFLSVAGYGQNSDKLVSTKTQISFFSTTPAEDIEANNTASVNTINQKTGREITEIVNSSK